MTEINGRQFVQTTAAATTGLALVDAARVFAAPGDIKFGYAAITWQGQDRQAIDEGGGGGFKGIQVGAPLLEEFGDKPAVLKALLAERGIAMVCLSSGNVRIEPEFEADD